MQTRWHNNRPAQAHTSSTEPAALCFARRWTGSRSIPRLRRRLSLRPSRLRLPLSRRRPRRNGTFSTPAHRLGHRARSDLTRHHTGPNPVRGERNGFGPAGFTKAELASDRLFLLAGLLDCPLHRLLGLLRGLRGLRRLHRLLGRLWCWCGRRWWRGRGFGCRRWCGRHARWREQRNQLCRNRGSKSRACIPARPSRVSPIVSLRCLSFYRKTRDLERLSVLGAGPGRRRRHREQSPGHRTAQPLVPSHGLGAAQRRRPEGVRSRDRDGTAGRPGDRPPGTGTRGGGGAHLGGQRRVASPRLCARLGGLAVGFRACVR